MGYLLGAIIMLFSWGGFSGSGSSDNLDKFRVLSRCTMVIVASAIAPAVCLLKQWRGPSGDGDGQ